MQTSLADFSRQLAETVELAGRGTVALLHGSKATVPGICWQPNILITADHALPAAESFPLANHVATAKVIGRDPGTDLAVLQTSEPLNAALTHAESLRPGHLALAVAPQGAAMGIVSSITDNWRTWRGGHVEQLIRLDLSLAPGLSGAAVVDAQARLIGLATRGLTRAGAVAIPTATIQRVVDAFLTRGRLTRGYLGVGLQPVALPPHLNKQGRALIIVSLEPDSPAEKGGLLLGDIVTAIDEKSIEDPRDVMSFLDSDAPGRSLAVDVLRAGQPARVEVIVGEKE